MNDDYQGLSALQISRFVGILFAAFCIWSANHHWLSIHIPNTHLFIPQSLFDVYGLGEALGIALVLAAGGYVVAAWIDMLDMSAMLGLFVAGIVVASYFFGSLNAEVTLPFGTIAIGISSVIMSVVAVFAALNIRRMKKQAAA